jgi:hypothetical protein
VLKSLEDKARKATAKNTTAAAETKKRIGASTSKVASKRRKTMSTSVAAPAYVDEEVALAEALPPWVLGRKAIAPSPLWILKALSLAAPFRIMVYKAMT